MRTFGKRSLWSGAIVAAMVLAKAVAQAQASPDEPAAVLVYPFVIVDPATGADTLIQLTNTSDAPVELRCFYEDFTPQCSSGEAAESCTSWAAVKCTGLCMPHRTVLPVRLRATPQQPLAWYASAGLQNLPLDGVDHSGPLGGEEPVQ